MELNRPVDARAYALGVCDAFCEVVRAGVKRIALSHPFTQDELDTVLGADFIRDCTAIAAQYGCGAHHQTEPLLTDLFPISLNAGRQNVIFTVIRPTSKPFWGSAGTSARWLRPAPTRATRGAKSPCGLAACSPTAKKPSTA